MEEDGATETMFDAFDDISVASYESGDELPQGSFGTIVEVDISTRLVYDAVGLSSSEFRVLTLCPASNKTDDIHCTLECVQFEATSGTGPVYEALSYAWGDSTDRCVIYVDSLPFPVTRNLDVALRYLRKSEEHRVLWIDAICIDQENLAEKTHQVRMMRDIYKNATRVLVWLGESDKDIRKAMALLQRADGVKGSLPLHPIAAKYHDRLRQREDEGTEGDVRNHYSNKNIGPFAHGLEKIFKKPWWFRLWVVQEVLVASHPPLVGCGREWVSRGVVQSMMSNLAFEQLTVREGFLDDPISVIFFGGLPSNHSDLVGHLLNEGTFLGTLLMATSDRSTTQPHDQVYAVLGLATEDANEDIDIDYEQPYRIAYQKALVHLLDSGPELSFLEYATNRRGEVKIPSWCIDFSNPAWWVRPFKAGRALVPYSRGKGASGNQTKSTISHQPDQGTIQLLGTVVGLIDHIHVPECSMTGEQVTISEPEEKGVAGDQLVRIRSVLKDIATFTQLVRKALEGRFGEAEALQMLASGIVWKAAAWEDAWDNAWNRLWDSLGEDNLAEWRKDLQSDRYAAVEKYGQLIDADYYNLSKDWSHLRPELPNLQKLKEWAKTQISMVGVSLTMGSLFSTDTGYIGKFPTVSETLELGDLLCVIYGCRKPIVLRPVGEFYKVVAFVPINDLADGQYFYGPERQTETFTLY
ncbi:MAG: hypothetical protein Q9207_004285 [Kuettlingeria erythrocarpa]